MLNTGTESNGGDKDWTQTMNPAFFARAGKLLECRNNLVQFDELQGLSYSFGMNTIAGWMHNLLSNQ